MINRTGTASKRSLLG